MCIYIYDKRMKHLTHANKHDRHLTQSSEAIDAQWQEMGMCIVVSIGGGERKGMREW